MAPPKMGQEWEQFAATHKIDPKPANIAEYRKLKQQRTLETQAKLQIPTFSLLTNVIVENTHITLPEVAGYKFRVRIYRPVLETVERLPVMVYFHGGYWCAGDSNSEDLGCRSIIARGNNIIIISFEYRLIPEVPWHTVFSDAEFAMKWLAFNADSIGGDTSQGFLVGGAEAGAHLAAICAIRARNRYPNIKLTGQCLIVPTTIVWPDNKIPIEWAKNLTSHVENAEAPIFDGKTYQMFLKALNIPDEESRNSENFPTWGPLENLPPAYLPMDECDPIRDQGFLYAELLHKAGVHTRTDYYRGLPNMFVQFPELPSTLVAGGHLSAGIAWLLQEKK